MPFLPDIAGPHDPVGATPARRAGSIRRTTTIDTLRPHGVEGAAVVVALARDLLTDAGGDATVVGLARIDMELAADGTIAAIDGARGLAGLVGTHPMRAFRRAIAEQVPDEVEGATLLHALLDDLVGANLVSGTAPQHHGAVTGREMTGGEQSFIPMLLENLVGICAGWADDSSMVAATRRLEAVPAPLGPLAPDLLRADDPLAWHDHGDLAPHSTRRRRRIDLGPMVAGRAAFATHFRDSHVDGEGVERIVHEYIVDGEVDCATDTVATITGHVQVLPWEQCPRAVASAARAAGVPIAELRTFVRNEMRGTTTCTHLNDTVRSLGDLAPMLAALRARSGVE